MTLRVSLSSLSVEGNRYYFGDELFSGIAIDRSDCKITKLIKVADGNYEKPYEGDLLKIESNKSLIDFSCLEEEEHGVDVPFLFNGSRFSGTAFEFDGAACVGEYKYEDGWEQNTVNYFISGELSSFDLMDDDFSQKVEFYENGLLKTIYLFERNLFHSTFSFNEESKVTAINVEGSYFEEIGNHRKKLYHAAFDKRSFIDFEGDEWVKISGTGISDEQIKHLCKSGLVNTTKLWLWRTLVTADSIKMLVAIEGLKELNVESEIITLDEMLSFKSQRPECYVEFNRSEVTV
ncbi:hypothetical protein MNBD_GAMMA11-2256 [hydrothermal vent metagenome]|uniref:Uncharacterized protein n=1 Tax=hydrothermal vent metagenome TaxID=652676 RepID=A0A3B0X9N3_9ZZZZ